MKIYKINSLNDLINISDCVLTIGFFDGLHKAHQEIIQQVSQQAQKLNSKSLIITFDDKLLLKYKTTEIITPFTVKCRYFRKMKIDYVYQISHTCSIMNYTGEEFIMKVLNPLNPRLIIVGHDVCFGVDHFKRINEYFYCQIIDCKYDGEIKISSKYIRKLLNDGNVSKANSLMAYDYSVQGKVISGKKLGRTINFPTANLKIATHFFARPGVYFGKTILNHKSYRAMINIGYNPTVDDLDNLKVEVYILDFMQNIYGKKLKVYLLKYHRPEKKFASIDKLKEQLEDDVKQLRKDS